MAEAVKGIPDSSSVEISRLFCAEVAAEIDFCKSTFGTVELGRRLGSDGKEAHAEPNLPRIGDRGIDGANRPRPLSGFNPGPTELEGQD